MTLTKLDPTSALIVVDLQKGVADYPTVHPVPEVVKTSAALARNFRRHRLPVVLANVAGRAPGRTEQGATLGQMPPNWAEFIDELGQEPGDHAITENAWRAFTGTDLEAHLRALGVTQVDVTGVATSAGVESTARQAHQLGFNVTLAADAMTYGSAEANENSLRGIFPRLGEVVTSTDIMALLD